MTNEDGEWIMKGLDWDNPYRIRFRRAYFHESKRTVSGRVRGGSPERFKVMQK